MTQPLVTSDAMLTGRFAWFDVVARQLDRLLAVAGVAILLVETTLLFVGVIARYVIHKPLVWSDEVNSILFLWLGMIGAVLAVRRWRHMQMSTFVVRLPQSAQSLIHNLGLGVIIAFLVLALPQAWEHMHTEIGVISPTLELSMGWRAAAMLVGIVLMLFEAVRRLFQSPPQQLLMAALLAVLGVMVLVRVKAVRSKITLPLRMPPKIVLWAFLIALPGLALPFIIRTAVVEGVATATEVSTVGVVYAVFVGILIYRRFDWRRLGPMLVDTVTLSGAILFVTGAATAMAWAITQSGFSQSLAAAVTDLPGGAVMFVAISVILFIVLGSVLEGLPAIVLFGPLLFPIARTYGIDPIYFAIVSILAMSLGLFAPPFGVGFYITCAIAGGDPNKAMRFLCPYLGVLAAGVVLIAVVPWFSTVFLK